MNELPISSSRALEPPSSGARITAFDFMKGALVLVMVLYHWLNYFSGIEEVYKYLRFLTPSFIFITGFLISNVYLARPNANSWKVPKRLLQRGLKLLALFIGLNLMLWSLGRYYTGPVPLASHISLDSIYDLYVVGNTLTLDGKVASFYILLPISYLLLVSAGLLALVGYQRIAIQWAAAISMLGALALYQAGRESANLELLAIGLLGVRIGCVPLGTISRAIRLPLVIAPAYFLYIAGIAVLGTLYPLQIVGVLLNLTILYLIAENGDESSPTRRCLILLGKYSLFGYLIQLAILQFLVQGFRMLPPSYVALGLTFILAPVLTIAAVVALDRARSRTALVNTVYTAVFA